MIKRSGALLLTMLYIITVFGFALNLHFCYGLLDSVKIDAPAESCKLLTAKKMNCCSNKQINIKVKDAHQAESQTFLSGLFAFDIPKLSFGNYIFSAQPAMLEKLSDRAPPLLPPSNVAPFIKNCTFRI